MQQTPQPKATYHCFTGTSPDPKESTEIYTQRCIQSFRDRYHAEPEQSFFSYRMLWVGPIPSKVTPNMAISPEKRKSGVASRSPVQLKIFQEQS